MQVRTPVGLLFAATIMSSVCGCNEVSGLLDLKFEESETVMPPGDGGTDDADSGSDTLDAAVGNDAGASLGCYPDELRCGDACVPNDSKNCGQCGHDCTALDHVTPAVACRDNTCVLTEASCTPGWMHCSADPDDGCESDRSDPAHCGSCGTACPSTAPMCAEAIDQSTAERSYECVSECPESAPDQCGTSCVDTRSDDSNCGKCGNECTAPANSQTACVDGRCGIVSCEGDYLLCDGSCLPNDVYNCGRCGNDCTQTIPLCMQAVCSNDQCDQELKTGYCFIADTCYLFGDANSVNDCQYCSASGLYEWSDRNPDYPCDDGLFCTLQDRCDGNGVCEGTGTPCDTDNPCDNTCKESERSCHASDITPCDDKDPMTLDDHCDGLGGCTGNDYCTGTKCWKVPPSGQTGCYDDDSGMICLSPCSTSAADYCGQDAQYPYTQPPYDTRTFTESASGGQTIVTDSLTGLVWQKTLPTDWTTVGCSGSSSCSWQQAYDYCDGLSYANQTDWRLPDVNELASLLDFGKVNPSSDFPDLDPNNYVSSSALPGVSDSFLIVGFANGGWIMGTYKSSGGGIVRCVRGARYFGEDDTSRFYQMTVSGDVVVLDRSTSLIWQYEAAQPKTWKDALFYCQSSNKGGYTDWRLANIQEIRSLINYSLASAPGSNFPGFPSSSYIISSTTNPANVSYAFILNGGQIIAQGSLYKTSEVYTTYCVRGGL